MINVKDERKEKVIDKNESDESETFFISSMINCIIDVEDEKREEVIDKNKSDENKNKET